MASTAFGDPTYAQDPSETTAQAAAPQGEVIDPSDPRLTSESMEEDLTADAYASLPVPPDGKWRAKLKLAPITDKVDGKPKPRIVFLSAKMNDGKPMFVYNVEWSLIDVTGKYDGIKGIEYWVKTNIDKRKTISQTSTIAKATGFAVPVCKTEAQRAEVFEKALAGEPEVVIDTAWKAECMTCQKIAKDKGEDQPRAFLVGMSHFPQLASKPGQPTSFDPSVQCPVCKSQVRAQLRIVGFLDARQVKATRGTA